MISRGKPEIILSARERLSSAFLGLLILLSAYIILATLSPEFVFLRLAEIEKVPEVDIDEVEAPEYEPIRTHKSLIFTEIPLGVIIKENLFGTTAVEKEETEEEDFEEEDVGQEEQISGVSRTEEIKRVSEKAYNTALPLAESSRRLWELSEQCSCELFSEDLCVYDPCANVRGEIEETMNQNIETVEKLVNVREELKRELILWEEERMKLGRAVQLMDECPDQDLISIARFLELKDQYEGIADISYVRHWDDIVGHRSWATFYCVSSGSSLIFQDEQTGEKIIPKNPITQIRDTKDNLRWCQEEIPVGEIMSRAVGISYEISRKLKNLIGFIDSINYSVNDLHYMASRCTNEQCSSYVSAFVGPHPYKKWSSLYHPYVQLKSNPCPIETMEKAYKNINTLIGGEKGKVDYESIAYFAVPMDPSMEEINFPGDEVIKKDIPDRSFSGFSVILNSELESFIEGQKEAGKKIEYWEEDTWKDFDSEKLESLLEETEPYYFWFKTIEQYRLAYRGKSIYNTVFGLEMLRLEEMGKLSNLSKLSKLGSLSQLDKLIGELTESEELEKEWENSFYELGWNLKGLGDLGQFNQISHLNESFEETLEELEHLGDLGDLGDIIDDLSPLNSLDQLSELSRLSELEQLKSLSELEHTNYGTFLDKFSYNFYTNYNSFVWGLLPSEEQFEYLGELGKLSQLSELDQLDIPEREEKVNEFIEMANVINSFLHRTNPYLVKKQAGIATIIDEIVPSLLFDLTEKVEKSILPVRGFSLLTCNEANTMGLMDTKGDSLNSECQESLYPFKASYYQNYYQKKSYIYSPLEGLSFSYKEYFIIRDCSRSCRLESSYYRDCVERCAKSDEYTYHFNFYYCSP